MPWTTDGSTELAVTENRIECTAKCQQAVNAIWKDTPEGVKDGKHFWTVKCLTLEGTGFCAGITDSAKFKKGSEFRGLMFGKSLTNGGGGTLLKDFGPDIKASDSLGIFVCMEGENLQLTFQLNGNSLGLAFDLPKNCLAEVFPVVQFIGKGTVTIEKITELPSMDMSSPSTVKVVYAGMEGPWEFNTGSVDPAGTPVSLQIAKDKDNVFTGIMNVVNTVQFKITEPKSSTGSWKADIGVFTKMPGDKAAMKVEAELTDIVKGLTAVTLEGELMTMKGKSGKTVCWKRHTTAPVMKTPVTANPFM